MKTALMFLFMGVAGAFGQGLVDFRNGGITFPTTADRKVYVNFVGNGPGLTGVNYVAGLWYLPGADRGGAISTAAQAGRTFNFRPVTTTLPGTWVVASGSSPLFTLNGVDIGQSATLQVRVWDGVKYATFQEAVAAGGFNISSQPFNYTVPLPGSTPDRYYMDNLRAFAYIPEPSTWAFIALAGFIIWRWKGKFSARA